MPISPEQRALYPPDWPQIRERIRARAGDRCEWCAVANRATVFRFVDEVFAYWVDEDGYVHHADGMGGGIVGRVRLSDLPELGYFVRIVCTVAHVHDPDPANCADENLAFLCQRCHNRHDRPMRLANAAATRARKKLEALRRSAGPVSRYRSRAALGTQRRHQPMSYKFPTIKGEAIVAVNIPAGKPVDIAFEVIKNGGPSFFNLHREEGGARLGVFAVTLLDPAGKVLATVDGSSKDPNQSRQLGSNAPHFWHVGQPKHTNTKMDFELEPGNYTYRIAAVDGKAYSDVHVGRQNGGNT